MTVDKRKTTVPPPDGGYGWVVVIAAFCCFNLIGTHLMAFGLLYRPVVDEYGTSYALAGFVGSISLAFAQLPGKFLDMSIKLIFSKFYHKRLRN